MQSELTDAFPQLSAALQAVEAQFLQESQRVQLPVGQFVCMEGQACSHLALILDGTVRVYKSGETGREITLYRLSRGESCILTASCILNERAFPAFAITETEVDGYVIPAPTFHRWVAQHQAWQHYVFQLLSRRLEAVIEVIEEVAFRRMDARLADYLLERATQIDSGALNATHEMIAADLGSSREVVSRLLKDFEREGFVKLGRGRILLEATDELRSRYRRM